MFAVKLSNVITIFSNIFSKTKNDFLLFFFFRPLFDFKNSNVTPLGKTHGSPTDDPALRMEGDLGNITADASGIAVINIDESNIKIFGSHSVIGRSIVICAGADDEGRGGHERSSLSGNAGPRVAYGVIGLSNPSPS